MHWKGLQLSCGMRWRSIILNTGNNPWEQFLPVGVWTPEVLPKACIWDQRRGCHADSSASYSRQLAHSYSLCLSCVRGRMSDLPGVGKTLQDSQAPGARGGKLWKINVSLIVFPGPLWGIYSKSIKLTRGPERVVYTCNPSYMGCRGRRIMI
jgi:hypothetical protein